MTNPPSEAKPFNKYLQDPLQHRLGYYKKGRFMYDYGRYNKKVPNPPRESYNRNRIWNGDITESELRLLLTDIFFSNRK